MEVVGFSDLNGVNAFQMALYKRGEKYYMYCGSFKGNGVNVVDVTDPANPVVLNYVEVSDPKIYFAQSTPKIQVANDLYDCCAWRGRTFPSWHKARRPC